MKSVLFISFIENIRVSSVMKRTMWCCVKTHDNYHVILYELVAIIEIILNLSATRTTQMKHF